MQKLFQVRVCDLEIDGKLPRPCLYYDMHRCLGPCVAGLTTQEEYAAAVEQARLFLAGRNQELLKTLRGAMLEASDRLEYERAAELRDAVLEVESIGERRKLFSQMGEDVDIFGVYVAGDNAAVTVFVMRGGQVLDRRELFWEGEAGPHRVAPALRAAAAGLRPHHLHPQGDPPADGDRGRGGAARLAVRAQGRARLPAAAGARRQGRAGGAGDAQRRACRTAAASAAPRRTSGAVESLRRHLRPRGAAARASRASTSRRFQGGETVASLVVWEEGRMLKGDYRSFNIRGLAGQDDFASMRQAVERALPAPARGGRARCPT